MCVKVILDLRFYIKKMIDASDFENSILLSYKIDNTSVYRWKLIDLQSELSKVS